MFEKIQQGKQLLAMRKEAIKMQKKLAEITHSEEGGGYKVKVSGDQKIVFIEKNGERLVELEKRINEALKNVQKKAAKQMAEEGGLGALLGNLQ